MCWSHPTCQHPSDILWCAAMHGLQQPGLGKGTLPLLEDGRRCFLFTGTVSLSRKWDWLRALSTALLVTSCVTSGRPLTLSSLCGHMVLGIRRFPVLAVVRAQGARRSAGEPLVVAIVTTVFSPLGGEVSRTLQRLGTSIPRHQSPRRRHLQWGQGMKGGKRV